MELSQSLKGLPIPIGGLKKSAVRNDQPKQPPIAAQRKIKMIRYFHFLLGCRLITAGRYHSERSSGTLHLPAVLSLPCGFQFLLGLAAVFEEEVGGFSSDYKRDWEIIRIW